ncbi:unnamed protein product [Kuraishia capsulata CBS 1993]|uniref:Kinesin-like protein n=1 Tax=Kuraishia capsulata CBS 1993 TaxID=1382522 RepID=W6MQ23_9ASCO|nr:uncharacterized protein KUCA_T00003315001 [Kuraishia capsulata CBS 1993]CDK27337.1 unnamed protein product [Kuraishia capsulata CBS 1993]
MSFRDRSTLSMTPRKTVETQGTPIGRNAGATRSRSNSPQKRTINTVQPGNVKVVARFRPENESEKFHGSSKIVRVVDSSTVALDVTPAVGSFSFDRVFDETCNQNTIFEYSIKETIDSLFQGYNGTVIAYGQTGSGKSYTMMGPVDGDPEAKGMIPRIADQIFDDIAKSSSDKEFTVGISYLEIYMEQLRDLLSEEASDLAIHESRTGEVYVKGLTNRYISGKDELYEAMKAGAAARIVSSTDMNDESSRSHAIFQISLTQQSSATGMVKKGTLFLVDLAGSEKATKTGASGQTLEEAKKINSSLSALGNVINALTDGSRHVPYRNSKLTRILQESLGGNSCTTLIVNCSPSSIQEQETLSSLRFGVRAKRIKNNVHVNAELSAGQLKTRLQEEQNENAKNRARIAALEQELAAHKYKNEDGGVELPVVPIFDYDDRSIIIDDDKSENEITRLNAVVKELSITNKILLSDLESRCTKIVELELENDRLKDQIGSPDTESYTQLDQTIAKLSLKIKDMEIQNQGLRKDIAVAQNFSETRSERVKELESQLYDQSRILQRDAYTFEERLGYLKSRLTAVKSASFGTVPGPLQDTTNNAGHSYTPPQPITPADISVAKQARNKVGLNLRILKPLRGGNENPN